jgi:ribosomal protein S17
VSQTLKVNYIRLKSELKQTSKVNIQIFKSEPFMVERISNTKGSTMTQIHKRFTAEQVKVLFQGYCQGNLSRSDVEEMLGIGKTRFFALLKAYHQDQDAFSITYHRSTQGRLSADTESQIEQELLRERDLIVDKDLPIHDYNYSALVDRLKKKGIQVSTTTVIKRAKMLKCYKPKKKRKIHDQEVLTASIGDLIQHDASLHKWSPYATEKWTLITSIDDYSRMLLYADFVAEESSWAHIQAAQYVLQTFGLPFRYYVDNLRVFRFVQKRDSFWRTHHLGTDDVDPQWKQVLREFNIDVIYALSPQAKGKFERPYRWLQDRIVRTCALDKLTDVEDVREVLREEVHRYNYQQVHSTTGEVPAIRFENARKAGNSLFRPFALPKPYKSVKDVFCLRATRTVDGYRRISLDRHSIEVPKVDLREDVNLRLVPDFTKNMLEVRIWFEGKMVRSVNLPLNEFRRFA